MKATLSGYYKPTPKRVQRILLAVKGILATVAGSSYLSGHEKAAFWIMIATGAISELVNLMHDETTA